MSGKRYIQFTYDGRTETVDEFPTLAEAAKMLIEYQMVGGGSYRISQRPIKGW